jgi:hypothetical protein
MTPEPCIARGEQGGRQVAGACDPGGCVRGEQQVRVLEAGETRSVLAGYRSREHLLLENDTVVDERVRPEVSVWLPAAAGAGRAIRRLADIEQRPIARLADITVDSVRIEMTAEAVAASTRVRRGVDLRAAALARAAAGRVAGIARQRDVRSTARAGMRAPPRAAIPLPAVPGERRSDGR